MASKRKRFSLEEKAEIILKAKNYKGSKADFSKSIGIPYSTLQTILKQAHVVEQNAEEMGKLAKKRKNLKFSPFEELENVLFQWFKEVRGTNIPINGTILKEKALEIALKLGIQGFTASNGWIDRFKKRHNLCCKSVCGESAVVDTDIVQKWIKETLPSLIQEYSSKDIFNTDETGLFYNLLPDKTFAVKGETCHGGKLSKLRLTVLLCTNSDGSEKLTPLVVGKSKKPRCFKNVKSFPTEYESNNKSWMTRVIFENFLHKLDRCMSLQKRKILLFVDQCTAHTAPLKLKNIRVEFLPANCTSVLQPCDLGIIRSFKVNYRNQLVKNTLLSIESGINKKKINMLEALHMVSLAWERVGKKCISNSFVKGGFPEVRDDELEPKERENGHLNERDEEETEDFQNYVACDMNVVTSEIPTISDLIDSASESSDEDKDVDETYEIPSATEAIQAIQVVKSFLSNSEGQERNLQKLVCVENEICYIAEKRKTQSKITDFFRNNKEN